METTLLVIAAIVGVVIAMLAVMKPIMDDYQIRKKVLNFDEGMRTYYFVLPGTEAELLSALSSLPEQKVVEYSYPAGEGIIRFRRENVEADYRLRFYTDAGKTYLSVRREAEEREQGNIPYLVNAFFIKNLRAEPVDFRKFQSLFPEDEE